MDKPTSPISEFLRLREVPQSNETTLRHALEISPLIKERTIGPDKPEWNQEDNQKIQSTLNPAKKIMEPVVTINKQKTPLNRSNLPNDITTKVKAKSTSPVGFDHCDFQALTSSICKRKLKEEQRQALQEQLLKWQQKEADRRKQNGEQINQHLEERAKRLAEKKRTDALLIQLADQRAQEEQKVCQQHLEKLRKQTEQQLQIISFQGVAKCQTKFRSKYESIVKLLMVLDKETQKVCGEHNCHLKELAQLFEKLVQKIKTGDFGPIQLKIAEELCKSLDELESSIIHDLEEYAEREHQQKLEAHKLIEQEKKAAEVAAAEKEKEEQRQNILQQEQIKLHHDIQQQQHDLQIQQQQQLQDMQQQQQQQVQDIQQQPQQNEIQSVIPNEAAEVKTVPTIQSDVNDGNNSQTLINISNSVHPERLQFYTHINQLYQQKLERVKPLQTNQTLQKYRSSCQKAINIPLNAITSVSGQHLQDKFEKLYNFISGQPHRTPEGQHITVNDHPLGRDYCLMLMAKKFVSQGETAVSSNPQAAFAIASVVVSLWKLVPDFGQTFLAYTFKESPYLVPYFKQGQSIEEQLDMYLKRQAGIARLYSAVMISHGRRADSTQPHPYGIEQAWRWLVHMFNLEPLPDLCATLILEVLQTVGFDLWHAYGGQFFKLLYYIHNHYLPRLSTVDAGGPKTRLEMIVAKFLRERQIPQAVGVLPAGFW